jgi:stress-induced morphogen
MAEGSQHGGHPIVKSIEEKLRAAITVEHFVCHLPPHASPTRVSGHTLTMQEIVDTSGNCGGSYSVVVVSPDFRKKMTLARHKLGKWIHRFNGHCRTVTPVVVEMVIEAGCASDFGHVSRVIILDNQGRRMRWMPSTSAKNVGRWQPWGVICPKLVHDSSEDPIVFAKGRLAKADEQSIRFWRMR